jgi:hypothetical protein
MMEANLQRERKVSEMVDQWEGDRKELEQLRTVQLAAEVLLLLLEDGKDGGAVMPAAATLRAALPGCAEERPTS